MHFYQTKSFEISIRILDQDHIKFQLFLRSSPTGSSLYHFFQENAQIIISYTSGLFLTTQKNNVGSRVWSTKGSVLASSDLIFSIFSYTISYSSIFFIFIYLSFKEAYAIAFLINSLSRFLISNSNSFRFFPVIFT